MPESERAWRAQQLRQHVLEHDLRRWLIDQLQDIAELRAERETDPVRTPS